MSEKEPYDFARHINQLLRNEIDNLAQQHGVSREEVLRRASEGMRLLSVNPKGVDVSNGSKCSGGNKPVEDR